MVENSNSMPTAPKYGSLHDHLDRQSRGFASGFVFLTFLLVARNIKQICDFLKAKEIADRRAAENRPPRRLPIRRCRDREFFRDYTGTRPGGVPDLEVRQARAKERREKEAKAAAANASRSTRARKGATEQGSAHKTQNEERPATNRLRASLRCWVLESPPRSG
ncbi:hypothetical protein E9228_000907 [Curtobacterium flaccumfaciens]|uniref:Uncharacterized protein n=1 Tax=Curtobacterium salicis TaxID=1779862 RepID=A0ABX0T463_9MICO|nr:hypothetical protein [Curtobacterium sp. WW7]NII40271.1 hypothetical protein [Curtobacterium sp. WW7]